MYLIIIGFLSVASTRLLAFGYSRRVSDFVVLLYAIFIFLIISLNSQNQDFDGYVEFFSDPSQYAEIGYVALVDLLKYLGFESHRSVLFVLALLVSATIYIFRRYSDGLAIFLIFYIGFLLPLDVVQIRNTFAAFLMLNSIIFAFNNRIGLFVVTSAVATSFHYLGALFILMIGIAFVLSRIERFKIATVGLLILVSFFSGFAFINHPFFLSLRTFETYLSQGKVFSVFVWGGVVFSYVAVVKFLFGDLYKSKIKQNSAEKKFHEFLFNIILSSLTFIAGLYFLYEFNRVYRFVLFVMLLHAGGILRQVGLQKRLVFYVYFVLIYFGLALYYSNELSYDYILFGF